MPSSFFAIETLLRGLQAQQRSVDVTNHNIANANTPGFSRQRAELAASAPYTVPAFNRTAHAGQIGTGVTVAQIDRMRDAFLDAQYRVQADQLGDAEARESVYRQVEVVFNEPNSSGFNTTLEQFWQSWQSLVNHPDDIPARTAVVERGSTLAASFNRIRQQIVDRRTETANDVALQVDQVNTMAGRIADLNRQISIVTGVGQQANDLMDARDQLLDQLAKLTGATTVALDGGVVNVYLGGRALVDRDTAFAVKSALDPSTSALSLVWQQDGATIQGVHGSVAALADMYNGVLPRILGDLTALRDTIVNAVNAQHEQGYGLNDPAGPPPGRDFFEVLPSGDVRVRPDIAADPSLVAAASGAGVPGDASNAVAIANLRDALVASGGTATIGQFYQAMIARIGTETQQVETIRTNQEAIVNTVDRQRQEVSSVSLDEEAANLVKYQHAYAAAARAMTVVDEMLDKIVNGMGIVGR